MVGCLGLLPRASIHVWPIAQLRSCLLWASHAGQNCSGQSSHGIRGLLVVVLVQGAECFPALDTWTCENLSRLFENQVGKVFFSTLSGSVSTCGPTGLVSTLPRVSIRPSPKVSNRPCPRTSNQIRFLHCLSCHYVFLRWPILIFSFMFPSMPTPSFPYLPDSQGFKSALCQVSNRPCPKTSREATAWRWSNELNDLENPVTLLLLSIFSEGSCCRLV